MGACASFGCGTRRGDCGAVCPGVLMQCPGAHTQVPASLPHFLKTAPSRAGIRGAAGRAAGRWLLRDPRCRASAAQRGPQAPQGRGAPRLCSRLCRGPLCRSCGPLGRFSSTLWTALSNGRGGRKRPPWSGRGAAGPGAGPLPARLSAAPPAGPRQQRTPWAARPQSTDKRLVFPLLPFPPALTGEGPLPASREAGGPAEKLGEGAAPDQDALASASLGPCHLPGRRRVPAARRVLCPEPRVYGVLLCPPREKITPLR